MLKKLNEIDLKKALKDIENNEDVCVFVPVNDDAYENWILGMALGYNGGYFEISKDSCNIPMSDDNSYDTILKYAYELNKEHLNLSKKMSIFIINKSMRN